MCPQASIHKCSVKSGCVLLFSACSSKSTVKVFLLLSSCQQVAQSALPFSPFTVLSFAAKYQLIDHCSGTIQQVPVVQYVNIHALLQIQTLSYYLIVSLSYFNLFMKTCNLSFALRHCKRPRDAYHCIVQIAMLVYELCQSLTAISNDSGLH